MSFVELDIKHGLSAYTKGCRCDVCREAKSAYNRAWLEKPGNREARREASREASRVWREKPSNREKHLEASLAWQRNNREATREASRAWINKPGNREAKRAATRAWRAKPENRAKDLEANRAWLKKPGNREANRVASLARLEKPGNREASRAFSLAWARDNPEKAQAKLQRYRSRKIGQFVENVDRLVLADRDGWECGICHAIIDSELKYPDPLSLSVDHVVPLSKGGEHSYANTQPAHWICNTKKGNRHEQNDEQCRSESGEP